MSIIRELERLRNDLVVISAIPCICGGKPGCETCLGVGQYTPGGIYNESVRIAVLANVIDAALDLAPEVAYTELKQVLRWGQSYNQEVFVQAIAEGEHWDPEGFVRAAEESFEQAGLPMGAGMRIMMRFFRTLKRGEPLTKKQLQQRLRKFKEGLDPDDL